MHPRSIDRLELSRDGFSSTALLYSGALPGLGLLGLISQARARAQGATTSIRATYIRGHLFSDSIDSYITN